MTEHAPENQAAVDWMLSRFKLRWPQVSEPPELMNALWYRVLQDFTPDELAKVTDYTVKEFRRQPVPAELIELRNRMREGKPLSEPIVSMVERLAYLILASDEFITANISMSELSDACLIAGVLAHQKSYDGIGLAVDPQYLVEEVKQRTGMFAVEAQDWRLDAGEGKGYWADVLGPKKSKT